MEGQTSGQSWVAERDVMVFPLSGEGESTGHTILRESSPSYVVGQSKSILWMEHADESMGSFSMQLRT